MPQTIQGFLAVVGIITLLLVVIGGEVKLLSIEIPRLARGTRLTLLAIAVVMLYISFSIYSRVIDLNSDGSSNSSWEDRGDNGLWLER